MKRLLSFIVIGTLGLGTAPALAQAPREKAPVPGKPKDFTLAAVRSFALPNGLEVTMAPYGATPKVAVRLVVRTGNIDETAETTWLSDLTRDLMLEGTTTRAAQQIAEEAARYGGAVGFNVGINESSIGADVLSEYGPDMVRLIADIARHPKLPESELARLKANRLRQLTVAKSRQQALANEKFLAALYPNHPYGRVFPSEAQLQGYTIDQARAFHAAHYGARRAHLYVVGRFDAAAMESAIRQSFADWQAGTAASFNAPTPKTARVIHVVDRPGAVQSTIYLGLPVIDPSHPDYVALRVTDAILGGSFGSRITSNIREQKGYTYSPGSTINSFLKNAYWAEIADVTTNVTGPSLKEIFLEIDRLQSEPPSREELESIQKYLAGIFVLQNSSRNGIIGQLQFTRLHGLGDDYLRDLVRKIYAVTPADVQRIAREYLKDDTMTIVIAGDRRVIEEQIKPFGTIME
jgi:predicted Zn-dependent peptidase